MTYRNREAAAVQQGARRRENSNTAPPVFCVLKKKIDSEPEICYNEPESLMPENKEDHL